MKKVTHQKQIENAKNMECVYAFSRFASFGIETHFNAYVHTSRIAIQLLVDSNDNEKTNNISFNVSNLN